MAQAKQRVVALTLSIQELEVPLHFKQFFFSMTMMIMMMANVVGASAALGSGETAQGSHSWTRTHWTSWRICTCFSFLLFFVWMFWYYLFIYKKVNLEYLKNIIVRYIELCGPPNGDLSQHKRLVPVMATCLQFSPEELRRCEKEAAASGYFPSWPFGSATK